MLQRLIFPFVFFLFSISACSQATDIQQGETRPMEQLELVALPDSTGTASDTLLAEALLVNAQVKMLKGAFKSSSAFAQRAKEIYEKYFGENHEKTASATIYLASFLGQQGEFEKAANLAKTGFIWYERNGEKNHENVARALMTLGNNAIYNGNFAEAKENFDDVGAILTNHCPVDHVLLPAYYIGMSWIEIYQGHYLSAIKKLHNGLDLLEVYHPQNEAAIAIAHSSLAAAYEGGLDMGKMISHYEIALGIYSNLTEMDSLKLGLAYNNFGNSLITFREWENAERVLLAAGNYIPANSPYMGNVNYGLGISFIGQKKFENAIKSLTDCRNAWLPVFGDKHPAIASVFRYLAKAEAGKKNYEPAVSLLVRSLDIFDKTVGKHHPDIAGCQLDMVALQTAQEDFSNAEIWLEKAFSTLMYHPSDRSFFNNPVSPDLLMYGLHQKAKVQIQKGGTENRNEALGNFERSLQIFDYLKNRVAEGTSKQFLTEKVFPIFEDAISCNIEQEKLLGQRGFKEKAFQLFERSKAAQLLAASREVNFFNNAGLPDSILEMEQLLKEEIAIQEKAKQEALGYLPLNDPTIHAINTKLFKAKDDHEAFIQTLEKDYPDYYRLKYDNSTIPLPEVQNSLLLPHQTLLEYFLGDSTIFLFVIKKDQYHVEEIKKDFPLEAWVDSLRHFILQPSTSSDAYTNMATKLYDKILRPVEHLLTDTSLIIVPDGALNYLPFDALLTERPSNPKNFTTYPYLLRKHAISYCYSATLLQLMMEKQHKEQPVEELLAFAPWTGKGGSDNRGGVDHPDQLSPIGHSRAEVEFVTDLTGGKALYDMEATKARFVGLASAYRILLLSLHGQADNRTGDYSWLAFYNGHNGLDSIFLYVRDLYNLQLNADMIFLSACETSLGELQRGEGIISLARAFAYAGAKSIVSTLWQVNDQTTAGISQDFFKHLKEGKMSKDKALRQAKMSYIANNPRLAQPFYWSGLIPVGDMGAVW